MPSPRRTIKSKTRKANAKRPTVTKAAPRRKPAASATPKEIQAPQFGKRIQAKAVEFRKAGNKILAFIWN